MIAMFRDYFQRLAARQRHMRTQTMIASLPEEILKDIGWPGAANGLCLKRTVPRGGRRAG